MQRIKSVGLVLAAVLAMSALLASAASSAPKPKILEIKKSGGAVVGSGETVTAVWEFTVGTEKCRNEMTGKVTVNSSKNDVFQGEHGLYRCGEFVGGGETSGAATFTFGYNGKASVGEVSFALGACTYTGKKFKGTNTTTGPLKASVSGKVKSNKGCKTKSAELKTVATEFLGPEEKFLQASL